MPELAALLYHLESETVLTADEREGVRNLPFIHRRVPAGSYIVQDGDAPAHSCFIIEGYANANKVVAGGQRQILSFYIAGDWPDLQSLTVNRIDFNVTTISSCVIGFVLHSDIHEMFRRTPSLAMVFWRSTMIQAAMFRAWIVNLGQRDAYDRVAHLLCEQALRMKAVKLGDEKGFPLFFTQALLSEATGASTVHVNRSLQALRRNRLIATRENRLHILDWEGLVRASSFDSAYLHQRAFVRGEGTTVMSSKL